MFGRLFFCRYDKMLLKITLVPMQSCATLYDYALPLHFEWETSSGKKTPRTNQHYSFELKGPFFSVPTESHSHLFLKQVTDNCVKHTAWQSKTHTHKLQSLSYIRKCESASGTAAGTEYFNHFKSLQSFQDCKFTVLKLTVTSQI